ncbi:MAG: hypothetical protein C0524_06970 [Rhodobacter sp.]|nr:hypothetical protein [Rhodobacter sp.]
MATLTPLLNALADLTETEPGTEAFVTANILRSAASTKKFRLEPPSILDAEIRAAAQSPDALPAARLVAAAQSFLLWQASPAAALQPSGLAATKAVVTLVSPEGPIHASDIRCGLYFQAPGTYYPLHAHNAAETYTILAGTALWQAGNDRSPRDPGAAIHHPPRMPHAMRAGPNGFLAIWRWSGDIAFESYHMIPDPEDPAR